MTRSAGAGRFRSACLAAAAVAVAAWVPPGAGRAQTASGPPGSVARWDAAAVMVDWARETRDPILMLAGARTLIAAGVGLDAASSDPWNPARVLSEARRFAKGRRDIVALMEETVQAARHAPVGADGEAPGLTRVEGRVLPGERLLLTSVFDGRAPVDAAIRLTRPTAADDVDVVVRDSGSVVVAEDLGAGTGVAGRSAYVRWTPATCGRFAIEVINAGPEAVDVLLVSSPARPDGCGD